MIDDQRIRDILAETGKDDSPPRVQAILSKAREMHGLETEEIATLMGVTNPHLLADLFDTARQVKNDIYGRRLVLFAPLYISNLCGNECRYCAFRADNRQLQRRALTQPEVADEVRVLIGQGHKRVLLVAGETASDDTLDYVVESVATIYATKQGKGEIRRVNVNIAPLTVDQFRRLKAADIGTYQLFQETYHRPTYEYVHVSGPKADYDWRFTAPDRAMEAGIDDLGVGVLFGLYDWRYELLALMQHVRGLEQRWGVGPHTISVPRLEPAAGSEIAACPPHAVSDADFLKIVAILRLAVPYTGIIMSTRETPEIRRETFALGVSQISAGSRTSPGGYGEDGEESGQFSLGDHRPLDEVIRDIAELGYIPSFCTGCYRLGRTGKDFMDLAKPGDIKAHCNPNAISTFAEYLEDYATPETKKVGAALIQQELASMDEPVRQRAQSMLDKVRDGAHDVFC
jgi:2-iminoacetate synthase